MLVLRRQICPGMALAAALSLAACAHDRGGETSATSSPAAAGARTARENAALRQRIQMLEDRVLHLERSAGLGGTAGPAGDVTSQYSLPDGRQLPIVRLDAPAAPRRARPEVPPEPIAEPPVRTRGKTLARMPDPSEAEIPEAEWTPPEEVQAVSDFAAPPDLRAEAPAPPKSFRLVGSRLVEMTREHGPKAPDRPARGKKAKGIVAQYEAAMNVYRAGALGDAEQAFDTFARTYPRHDYADNALYWKGEAAYDQAHYSDALAAFTEVVERYGGGNKAADALLKIGLCYRELGDDDNARDVLTRLIDAYPGERASDIARVKLAEFGI